jgi:hypothetical protein
MIGDKSIEELYNICKSRFKDNSRVHLFLKSSAKMASDLKDISGQMTFWLDGHYSFGPTSYEEKVCPIMEELEQIKTLRRKDHFILVDDVRLFGTEEFMFITLDEIKARILEINPNYHFRFENGHIANDILVAYVEPVVTAYNSFQELCRVALTDETVENNFRRHEITLNMLEFLDPNIIDHYYGILEPLQGKYSIPGEVLSSLDTWGNPIIINSKKIKLAPASYRYWMYAMLIATHGLTNSSSNILEIGAGFGGQAFTISKMRDLGHLAYASYTIVDLPGVVDLQRKFLEKSFVKNFKTIEATEFRNEKYDLVIANYSFAEFPQNIRDFYTPVLERAEHAVVAWNSRVDILPLIGKAKIVLDDVMGYKIYLW